MDFDNYMKLNIKVCRVCLKSDFTSIFIFDNKELLEKFQYTTQLKIKENDGMPEILCERCIARLKIANDFRRQAHVSDNQLRSFINKVHSQFKEVTDHNTTAVTTNDTVSYADDKECEINDEDVILLLEAGYKSSLDSIQVQIEQSSEQHSEEIAISDHHHHRHRQQFKVVPKIEGNFERSSPSSSSHHTILNVTNLSEYNEANEEQAEVITIENHIDEDSVEIEEGTEHIKDEVHLSPHLIIRQQYNMEDDFTTGGFIQEEHSNDDNDDNDEEQNSNSFHHRNSQSNDSFINTVAEEDEVHLDEENFSNAEVSTSGEDNTEYVIGVKENFKVTTIGSTIGKRPRDSSCSSEKPKHESRSNICIKCDKDFSTKTNLMRHMLSHDGTKPYRCKICGNGFTQSGSLKQHMLIHTGEKPFRCEVCERRFTQAKSLVFHMRRHTGEKPYTCDRCDLSFRQKDGLKRHILTKHSTPSTESHECTICKRVLQSKYSLALHMKKHLGLQEKTHKCDICEKCFSTKNSLDVHQRLHTGEKPFKCENCNKEFPRKSSLLTHIKRHEIENTEKQFKCNECDKGFAHREQIVNHMQNHKIQPPKSFQCGKCYKSFGYKRNLLQHLRNHNRESMEIFECEDCKIAFNTKRALKLHRYNEHKENVSDLNECDICHIPFVAVSDLNNHMMEVHDCIDEKCRICLQHFTSKKLLEDHILEHELTTTN